MSDLAQASSGVVGRAPRAGKWRRLAESPAGLAGAAMLVLLAAVAVAAPVVVPYDPLAQVGMPFQGFSWTHPLGSDELGRDILSRIIYGLRLSLLTAVATSIVAAVVGVTIGLLAGYFGGWPDSLAMRIMDVVLSVPAILLAIVLVAIMGGGLVPLIVAIAVVAMPSFARLTRASVMSVKQREFVAAQRAAGASNIDILLRTILPNVLRPTVVQLTVTASTAVLTESGLSFLGLGAPPPSPSLGSMLAAGNENLFMAPLYPVVVGLAIAVLVATFDAFGAGLQRVVGGSARRSGVVA